MKFIRLDICDKENQQIVGGKAKWLGKLINMKNINVPAGFCISTRYFEDFIDNCENKEEICRLKNECLKRPITARKNLSKIRDIILQSDIDETLINDIIADICELGIDLLEGIVVRSSSVCEDGKKMSYAGVFSSTTDVCDILTLKQAILMTWASQFSELCYVYDIDSVNSSMAVIIQKMVKTDLYGVMFSKAPYQNNLILIEMGNDVSQIVDGYEANKRYYVDREKREIVNNSISTNEIVEKLVDVIFEIENYFSMFCDLEFAVYNDMIYLIQCRPQTNVNNFFEYKIINNDDVAECGDVYLGPCETYYNRYLGKQYLFRRAVLESGFSVYKQYFIIINDPNKLENAVIDCMAKFCGVDFVILEFGSEEKSITCKLIDLESILREKLSVRYPVYCRIGELIDADKAGYICLNDNKEVLVEYTLGRMSGIQNGRVEPIKVLIDSFNATYLSKPEIKEIDIIDKNTGKRVTVNNKNLDYPYLTNTEELQLKSFANKLSQHFNNASFEWYINKGILYGKDISVETDNFKYNKGIKNVISMGKASGVAYVIEDLSTFDLISNKYNLSLYAHDNMEYQVYSDDTVMKLINELKSLNKPIIFAQRPTNGILPLSEYIGGCVFKYGSILSHIGICMREKKIPSCIVEKNIFETVISKKSIVEIEDGEVKIIND